MANINTGPLLFIIYTNDISNACDIFKSIVYANDTTLMSTLSAFNSHGENNVSDNINEELAKIDEWLKLNKLWLNVKKSKFMLLYMPGRNLQIPNLHINNIKLECLDSFNFLGITIDKHLPWEEHINLIANKISSYIQFLYSYNPYVVFYRRSNKLSWVLSSELWVLLHAKGSNLQNTQQNCSASKWVDYKSKGK